MSVPELRLIAYYQSPAFAADYAYLERYAPLAAEQQRHAIMDSFIENLKALGITPTPSEQEVQERFLSGELSLPQKLEQVELYVCSIMLRWPQTP